MVKKAKVLAKTLLHIHLSLTNINVYKMLLNLKKISKYSK
jgi:hypothetical protein